VNIKNKHKTIRKKAQIFKRKVAASAMRFTPLQLLVNNRRAVSTAISSIIMVAAVITVGLAVLAWANNNFASQQQESTAFFNSQNELMRENFVIEDVWFHPSTSEKDVDVTLRNVGNVDMNVTAIHFNATILSQNQRIIKGSSVTIHIQDALLTWSPEDHFYVKVVSARGQQIREYYSTTG
jgi:archaellum component FlaF (FlaF/FlaG flagellin family)